MKAGYGRGKKSTLEIEIKNKTRKVKYKTRAERANSLTGEDEVGKRSRVIDSGTDHPFLTARGVLIRSSTKEEAPPQPGALWPQGRISERLGKKTGLGERRGRPFGEAARLLERPAGKPSAAETTSIENTCLPDP